MIGNFSSCRAGVKEVRNVSARHVTGTRSQSHPPRGKRPSAGSRQSVVLHSRGNVNEIIPDLIDSGFDCLMPLELRIHVPSLHHDGSRLCIRERSSLHPSARP